MRRNPIHLFSHWMLIIVTLTLGRAVLGQEQRNVDIGGGSLVLTVHEGFAGGGGSSRLVFPREYNVYFEPEEEQLVMRGAGILIAAKDFGAKAYYLDGYPNSNRPNKGWVTADSLFPHFVITATPNVVIDVNHWTVPVLLRKYWKYSPPTLIVNNEDCTPSFNTSTEEIRSTIVTQEMGIAAAHTAMGFTVTERDYILGNPDYDDFAIVEYVFKYTGETGGTVTYGDPVKDCYVGIKFYPIIYADEKVVEKSGGWVENTDDWVDYAYADGEDTVRVMYGWDGDASSVIDDDEGDPWVNAHGAFLCPQYPGMAVLHADKSTENHANDMSQPHHAYVSYGGLSISNALSPGPGQPSMSEIYRIIDEQDFFLVPPIDWEKWNTSQQEQWLRGTSDPTDQYSQMGTLSFGPYDFDSIGDSIRIVVCYTVGSIGWPEALDLGARWKAGSISRTEKNQILRSGRDSLFTNIKSIKELFKTDGGGYDFTIETIVEKIQAPPPWPEQVELAPEVGSIRIEWTPVESASAYRVYRRLKQKFQLEAPEPPVDEPGRELYPLVFQTGGIDPGDGVKYSSNTVTVWLDSSVVPAQHYWYYVTAINADGVESSHFITRTGVRADDPLYCSCTPYEIPPASLDSVFVVPNPYHAKAVELGGGIRENIDFVGLPAVCRIRIFTQSGELVKTIKHELVYPPSTTESWNMETASEQTIATGLYVYVIDKVRDENDRSLSVTRVGKFVVVR